MATSGTTVFDLQIDDLVEEAFERLGMQMTNGKQLSTARRSLNLMFLEWANRGLNLWTIELATYNLVQGDTEISLPTDTVNVLSAVIRLTGQTPATDIIIERISRAEYLNVPDKTTQAQPAQYYVQRTNVPKVFLYPTPDQRASLEQYVQDAFEQFRGNVLRRRLVSADAMRGQAFLAPRALANNLIDKIALEDEAMAFLESQLS